LQNYIKCFQAIFTKPYTIAKEAIICWGWSYTKWPPGSYFRHLS